MPSNSRQMRPSAAERLRAYDATSHQIEPDAFVVNELLRKVFLTWMKINYREHFCVPESRVSTRSTHCPCYGTIVQTFDVRSDIEDINHP